MNKVEVEVEVEVDNKDDEDDDDTDDDVCVPVFFFRRTMKPVGNFQSSAAINVD